MMHNKYLAVCAATLAVFLTACQPTPAEDVVVNKGNGMLEIKLQATAAPSAEAEAFAVPNEWRETLEVGDSRVVFDATVECPVAEFPVFEVANKVLTAQNVNELLDRVTPNAARVWLVGSSSEELNERLAAAIRGWWYADASGEGYYGPYEGQEEDIARLQEQLAKTVDESALYAPFERLPVQHTVLCDDGQKFTVYAFEDCWSFTVDLGQSAVMQWERLVASGGAIGNEPPGTQIGEVSITPEWAAEQARAMLHILGMDGMQVASVEKARMVNAITDEVLTIGYQLILSRSDGGYAPFDALTLSRPALHFDEQASYRKPWYPERMQMFVDERGVRYVEQMYTLRVLRIVNENTELLPFEQAQELLKNRFRHEFRWTEAAGTVTVDRVALVGALVRVKNDPERAYIVPTWLCEFTSTVGIAPDDVQRYAIAINAIDGSNVDVQAA